MRIRTIIILALLLSACATVHTYDLGKIQGELSQSVQNTEAVMQKSQTDFREKTALYENLRKTPNADFTAIESKLRRHLANMKSTLATMTDRRKTLNEANGQIAAMAYSHKQVRSDEAEYPRVDETLRQFQTSLQEVNAAVLDYSRESNSMADEVADHKLFYNFDVAEFQKRVQQTIKAAQATLENMRRDLTRSQTSLSTWTPPESQPAAEGIFKEMETSAQDYSTKAQKLSQIAQDMHDLVMGSAHITTLDPNWPQARELIDRLDSAISSLNESNSKFQTELERFRNPVKRAQ